MVNAELGTKWSEEKNPKKPRYLWRLPKGQEPTFLFAFPTDQLLICLHQNQSTYIEICGSDIWNKE